MRFKEMGKKLQLMRPIYVPEDGRTREKMIGSIDADAERIPPEIFALLTEGEAVQLYKELNERTALRRLRGSQNALGTGVVDEIGKAIEGLKWAHLVEAVTPEQVEAIWTALDEMRSAMRKAKLEKPKKTGGKNA